MMKRTAPGKSSPFVIASANPKLVRTSPTKKGGRNTAISQRSKSPLLATLANPNNNLMQTSSSM